MSSAATRSCPLCGADRAVRLLCREAVPALSNRCYRTRDEARAAPAGRLDLVACAVCGFTYNRDFDPALAAYDPEYENDQAHSPGFSSHLDEIQARLLAGKTERILEIGCGQGRFLETLVTSGAGRRAAIGYDAAWRSRPLPPGMRIERAAFDHSAPDCSAAFDLIYARHVIEHVAAPVPLLRVMARALAPGGRVCLETPSLEWILQHGQMQDFFYEHCNYFTAASLKAACTASGLGRCRVETLFGGQYLWLEAQAGPAPRSDALSVPPALDTEFFPRWRQRVDALRAAGPVALWGAAAKGVTFATEVDPAGERIDCLIDINPLKQGWHVPCSGHRVLAPDAAAALGIRSIIVMNPIYRDEIAAMAETAGMHARLFDS